MVEISPPITVFSLKVESITAPERPFQYIAPPNDAVLFVNVELMT